jgi:hypothetical protein
MKLDLEQCTDEWLAVRQQHLTASDARLALLFLEDQKSEYYDSNIYSLLEDKISKTNEELSSFKKQLFSNGHLAEELIGSRIKNEVLSKGWNYEAGNVYKYNNFLSSLDVLLSKDNSLIIYECKNVNSDKVLSEYKNFTHPNYYQVAFQLYLMQQLFPNQNVKAFVIAFSMENEELYKFELDEQGKHYQALKKHLNSLIKISDNIAEEKSALHDVQYGGLEFDRDKILEEARDLEQLMTEKDKLVQDIETKKKHLFSLCNNFPHGYKDNNYVIKSQIRESYTKRLLPEVEALLHASGYNSKTIYYNDPTSLKLTESLYFKART